MKRVKTRKFLLIMGVVLAFLATSVVSFAYFSDYEHALGKASVRLAGQTEIEESWQDLVKTVSIKNTGESDVIVRAAIYGPDGVKVTLGEGWTEKQSDGWYYYDPILTVGESTTEIVANAEGIEASVDLSEFDIIVVQESAPVAYEDDGTTLIVPSDWKYTPAGN